MRRESWAALLLLLSCGSDPDDANGDGIDDVAVAADTRTLILLGKPTNP